MDPWDYTSKSGREPGKKEEEEVGGGELVKAWLGVRGCSSCHLVHFQKSFTFLHPKVPGDAGGGGGGGGGGGLWSGSLSRP